MSTQKSKYVFYLHCVQQTAGYLSFFFMNILVLLVKEKRTSTDTNTDTLEDTGTALSHLAQRPFKNKEITIRSKNPVLPEIARRLHQPPPSSAAVVEEDTMATPEPKEPIASKL